MPAHSLLCWSFPPSLPAPPGSTHSCTCSSSLSVYKTSRRSHSVTTCKSPPFQLLLFLPSF
ncbi:hypothetical protein EXN66_Car000120 [Channa argus]|uniref:Uncharacterized protein n=1 Tax=Channa argus TaxID=215402 RepID=A0A6G1QWD0_CHAAH|nr:hypothetical protein EXN66_Car000005 [Channa argus]KAF3706923.1 hypothetical protein EXN66_Car000094 [Channa argus]KAF3706947.1 hypothetical protein EXN66_Car000118 [Channa argus]KAF3706949.1 hypothetical protein EXN66_Car000120 [Channa argus]